MLIDILVITSLLFVTYGGYLAGKRAQRPVSYWKGRGEGWRACEDSIIERAKRSDKIDLTDEEVLEELLQ